MMAAEEAAAAGAEEAAPAVHDPAEMLGLWWAKLTDPATLSRMLNALTSVIFVLIVVVAIYMVAMVLFRRAIARVECEAEECEQPARRRAQRVATVLTLLQSIAKWVIVITGAIWVLASGGLNITPVLAGAGVVGLAVGFGSQNLVRDLVSGFFLLLEGQYAVGDYIQVGAMFGMVETIGMRVTVLLDLDNQRHYLPNGGITTVTVYEEPFVNHVIEVPVADPDRAAELAGLLDDLAPKLREQYPHHLVYYKPSTWVPVARGALVRFPVAAFPTQEWLVNEEIPQRIRDLLADRQIAMIEGRDIRVYMDLSRMPTYNVDRDEVVQIATQ